MAAMRPPLECMEGCTRDPSHVHVRERRALRVNKHNGVGGQDMIGGPKTLATIKGGQGQGTGKCWFEVCTYGGSQYMHLEQGNTACAMQGQEGQK